MAIMIPVSWGELLDKITILEIKAERIDDAAKNANVRRELEALEAVAAPARPFDARVEELIRALRGVNEELWAIEDDIRACERERRYDDEFIRLARAVYITNDRRSELKRELNRLLDSELVEEKSYAPYA